MFDTDPKLDHAPIVQYCATSSIEHGHSRAVSDLHWLPEHMELCQKTAAVLDNPALISSQLITAGIDGSVSQSFSQSVSQSVIGSGHRRIDDLFKSYIVTMSNFENWIIICGSHNSIMVREY